MRNVYTAVTTMIDYCGLHRLAHHGLLENLVHPRAEIESTCIVISIDDK